MSFWGGSWVCLNCHLFTSSDWNQNIWDRLYTYLIPADMCICLPIYTGLERIRPFPILPKAALVPGHYLDRCGCSCVIVWNTGTTDVAGGGGKKNIPNFKKISYSTSTLGMAMRFKISCTISWIHPENPGRNPCRRRKSNWRFAQGNHRMYPPNPKPPMQCIII